MGTEFVVGAFACAIAAVVAWDWLRSRDGAPPGERGDGQARRGGAAAGGGAPGAGDGGCDAAGCGDGGGDGGGE